MSAATASEPQEAAAAAAGATDQQAPDAVVTDLIAELAADAVRLGDAIAVADLDGAARSAHRIKGAAGMVGAQALAAVAGLIEFLANKGDVHGSSVACKALSSALHNLDGYIESRGHAQQRGLP